MFQDLSCFAFKMKLAASCFIRLLWNVWELKKEYVLNDKLQVDYKDYDNN